MATKTKATAKAKAKTTTKPKAKEVTPELMERTIQDKTMEQLCKIFNLAEGDTEKFMSYDDDAKAEALKESISEVSADDFKEFSAEAQAYLKELGYKTEDEKAESLTAATATENFTKETAVCLAILLNQDEFEIGDIVAKSVQIHNSVKGKTPSEFTMDKVAKKMLKLFTNAKVKFVTRNGDTFKVNPEMYLALKIA